MTGRHRKPESGPLGTRTARAHAPDGWTTERDRSTAAGKREDDRAGFPAGNPERDVKR
jgi:hypothetical protein